MEAQRLSNYLKMIDFEPPDDDRANLFAYLHNNLYGTTLPYDTSEYRTPKYFRLILKEIRQYIHYCNSSF